MLVEAALAPSRGRARGRRRHRERGRRAGAGRRAPGPRGARRRRQRGRGGGGGGQRRAARPRCDRRALGSALRRGRPDRRGRGQPALRARCRAADRPTSSASSRRWRCAAGRTGSTSCAPGRSGRRARGAWIALEVGAGQAPRGGGARAHGRLAARGPRRATWPGSSAWWWRGADGAGRRDLRALHGGRRRGALPGRHRLRPGLRRRRQGGGTPALRAQAPAAPTVRRPSCSSTSSSPSPPSPRRARAPARRWSACCPAR